MVKSKNIPFDRAKDSIIREPGSQRSVNIQSHHSSPQSTGKTTFKKVVTGTTIYSLFNWFYDYILYSSVIWLGGVLWGGLSMIILSVFIDLLSFKFYDWSHQDWFAIEYLKSLRDYKGGSLFKKCLGYILRETPNYVQVMALSIKFNSFIVTALMREGIYEYKGLSSKDWKVFWLSNLIGQLYWICLIGSGVELGKYFMILLS